MSLTGSMFTSAREAVIGHNSGQLSSHASNVAQTFCKAYGIEVVAGIATEFSMLLSIVQNCQSDSTCSLSSRSSMFHDAVQRLTPEEGDSNLILIDRSVESKN